MRRGKLFFLCEEYQDALHDLNDSIRYQHQDWRDKSYAKELIEMRNQCIKQIEEAKKLRPANKLFNYSKELVNSNFQPNFEHLFSRPKNYVDVPFLTENELLPGASAKIEMAFDPEKGRIMKSKTNIRKGTLILAEKAFASWLQPSLYAYYCYNCIKQIPFRSFPCRRCVRVNYCNSHCEEEAWNSYHSVECDYMDAFKNNSYGHLAAQILIAAGVETVFEVAKEGKIDAHEWPERKLEANYKSFYSLVSHEDKFAVEHSIMFGCGVCVIVHLLEKINFLQKNDPNYYLIAGILLKHIFQINLNCFLVRDRRYKKYEALNILAHTSETHRLGMAVVLSGSMFGHSCDYNTDCVDNGASLVMVLQRDVEANEEITISYSPHYKQMCFRERQSTLMRNYFFTCRCVACENGWENKQFALRCPQCDGSVYWFSDNSSNYCVDCERIDIDFKRFAKIESKAEKLYESVDQMLKEKKLKNVKSVIEKYTRLYSKTRRDDFVAFYYALCLCRYYQLKKKYKRAYRYARLCLAFEKALFGEQSLEVANSLLRMAHYLKLERNSRPLKAVLDFECKRELNETRREAIDILVTFKHGTLRLVNESEANFLPHFEKIIYKHGAKYGFTLYDV
ncbi:SET and MYND domain-containing protein (SMYD)-like protein [Dinothrombium tinctorium]|uniref:Protein-lysine N-methyltransferase SMYD4 n=1 Tax=Dinothrombium tinctorium TaxID=1965070 RepID=A0A3S3RFZ3_9ACAR|nr:SET and MYND domain-containing protein (SMYD)-like protein [Dinothrombium tinctorium]RWS01784.1 SET and MYND domain-containing protein (SMYD)-like protein [Dinothrombium tinctorium]RWS03910.1 SET and MYND domain-containing protein (SMYD)-like protein [Dinothrombium tinctorium]